MRVSRTHATRALDAVRTRRRRVSAHRHGRRPVRPTSSLTSGATPMTIDLALRTIDGLPPVRVHLVEAAAARLAAGERPTSDAIADMAIRRATCDLLR
jgi:hypothetical protein